MRAPVLLGALLAASCGGNDTLWIGSPPTSGMRSMLVAVDQGGVLNVSAASLDPDPGGLVFPIADREAGAVRFEALLYPQTLVELGLEAGAVAEAPETDPFGPLPSTSEVYVSQVEPGNGSVSMPWTRAGAMSQRVASFRMKRNTPPSSCAKFKVTLLSLDDAGHGTIALALDRDRALVATTLQRFYVVTRTSVRALNAPLNTPHRAAARDENGVLWLGGDRGEVWRATLADSLMPAPVTTAPSGEHVRGIFGDAEELYTAGEDGSIERYAGGQWTLVKKFPKPTGNTSSRSVAVLRHGEAVAVSPLSPKVVRYSDGVITEEPTTVPDGITAVAHVPGFGTVVGTSNGAILSEAGGTWSPMTGNDQRVWVTTIEPYEDGFVFGGPFGNFAQWKPGVGFCPRWMPVAFSVNYATALGADLVLLGSNSSTQNTAVAILEREP